MTRHQEDRRELRGRSRRRPTITAAALVRRALLTGAVITAAACAPGERGNPEGGEPSAADAGTVDASTADVTTAGRVPRLVAAVDGLSGPEAVRYDPDQDLYFVANFGVRGDDPRDDNGFISRVGADGEVLSLRSIVGAPGQPLHMPRGMALAGDTLWVADVDGVHGFHRRTGRAVAFIDFTGHEPGFLNDIAVGPDGALYVTDTGEGRVYRVARRGGAGFEASVEVAIEDPLTGPPNGITWDEGREAFLLAPWGGGQVIRSWTRAAGLREVVTIPGGRFDGIEVVAGRIVVASQTDSTIWVVYEGEPRPAVRVEGAPADIGVDTRRGHVAVPYIARDRVEIWWIPEVSADPGVSGAGPAGR